MNNVSSDDNDYTNVDQKLLEDPNEFKKWISNNNLYEFTTKLRKKVNTKEITKRNWCYERDQRMQNQQRHIDYPKSIRVILTDPRLDQLVIDTTGTGHCLLGEYLKDLIKSQ